MTLLLLLFFQIHTKQVLYGFDSLAFIAHGLRETPCLVEARPRIARLKVFLRRQSCLKNDLKISMKVIALCKGHMISLLR